jgi:hypothetical protein
MISSGERMPRTLATVAVLVEAQSMPLIESAVTFSEGARTAATDRNEFALKSPFERSQGHCRPGAAE